MAAYITAAVDPRLVLLAVLGLMLVCSAALLLLGLIAYSCSTRPERRYPAYEVRPPRAEPCDYAAAIREYRIARDRRAEEDELRRAA